MKLVEKVLCTTVAGAALFGLSGLTALAWADSVSNVSSRAVEVPDGSDGAPDGGSEPVGAMHQLSDTSDVIDTSAGR
jgi:hypothetical protein